MPREYGFGERLQMSQGISDTKDISEILMANIPGAVAIKRANERDDRNGTDFWVAHARGQPYSVDVKVRGKDYCVGLSPCDDLALETWSVVEKQIIGWTRNPQKMTDYVLWYWRDTGRWCLVPFVMLCAVFSEQWSAWAAEHGTSKQRTPTAGGGWYHSECTFVPRREVWAAIYRKYSGSVVVGKPLYVVGA